MTAINDEELEKAAYLMRWGLHEGDGRYFLTAEGKEELAEVVAYLKSLIASHDREIERKAEKQNYSNLVLFGGELAYCLANDFPIGEGHTPPSMVYESMESKVDKWLKSRTQLNAPMEGEEDE